jgi:2,3-oxidosqualene cyclase
MIESSPSVEAPGAMDRAIDRLLSLQGEDGAWEGEMVWCTMILSQYVIVHSIVGRSWDIETRAAIVRHYDVTRTPEGSWGLHPESGGYVFCTTLAYVALRLLGLESDHLLLAPARRWLHAQPGGVLAIPTWGKFWLALLDCYGYEGINPTLPELFLMPRWLPFHPRRYYCHTRYIYLGVAFLFGNRFRSRLGPIVDDLRRELYPVPYESVDFAAHRHEVAPSDLYVRPGWLLRLGYGLLSVYDRLHLPALRRASLACCLERIRQEQRNSRYQALSPVNGLLNCLALLAHDPGDPDLRLSLEGLEAWKWQDDVEGLRYAGARSQIWDTAFAVQALLANSQLSTDTLGSLRRAYAFLTRAQQTEEIPQQEDRDRVKGGWCFSDGAHRWPVSDCTAEALDAILAMHDTPGLAWSARERVPDENLFAAAFFILDRQNSDGGFGTYERRRGSSLLEHINPSEMFGQCMTEGSYTECTGSALTALCRFRTAYPAVLRECLDRAIVAAVRFLRGRQEHDGSWAGFWGINFIYGTFHAVRGLRAAGVLPEDLALVRAADWLVRHQRADGGWGEHFRGCLEGRYVEHPDSQAVMTSWALLALLELVNPRSVGIERGVGWLHARQRPDGSWPREAVNGVFFGTAMLDYRLYPAYFPTWALARYEKALRGGFAHQ